MQGKTLHNERCEILTNASREQAIKIALSAMTDIAYLLFTQGDISLDDYSDRICKIREVESYEETSSSETSRAEVQP